MASPAPPTAPLASIGILTDIQCADVDDGTNFTKTERRYYRHALNAAQRAMQHFAAWGTSGADPSRAPVQAVLHLGDLLDGYNAAPANQSSERMLAQALRILPAPATTRVLPWDSVPPLASSSATPTPDPHPMLRSFHLIGNHELVNLPRSRWASALGMGALARKSEEELREELKQLQRSATGEKADSNGTGNNDVAPFRSVLSSYMFPTPPSVASAPASSHPSSAPLYYDIRVAGRYRLLMLDACEVSILGYADESARWPEGVHPYASAAREFLDRENPNENKLSPEGMEGIERRKVAFNGGMSQRQLEWLQAQLECCARNGEYAILCSHIAFHPHASHPAALLWNLHELLSIVEHWSSKGKGTVVACLHGHDHDGGHVVDERGVVHHTFEAVLTTPSDGECFRRMDFYADRVEVHGTGNLSSFVIPVPPQPPRPHGVPEEVAEQRVHACMGEGENPKQQPHS